MFTRMRNTLRVLGERGHTSTRSLLPKLSGAELAKSSWATRIESCSEVPDPYASFFEPLLAGGGAFPYTVLTPSHERFIHRQAEKLICACEHKIAILERNGNAFEAYCYPFDEISYIEFRTALLASSLKICGMTSAGLHTTSALIFNSVTDYLFAPIMKKVRLGESKSEMALQSSEQERFNHLVKVNFKFMNYARHSLLEGESVMHSIFQPEIRTGILAALGRTFYKTISPTHMTILTDRELILIREDTVRRKEDKYGGIWDYIPLSKIMSLSASDDTGKLLVLAVQLPENTCFELLFQSSAREEVKQLLDRFRQLTNR